MYEELVSHLRECAKLDPSENTFSEAADAIEYMKSYAKVLEKIADYWCKRVPKWIPVTERLPEKGQYVLVYYCGNMYVYEFRVLSETDDKAEICWEDDYGYFQRIEDEQFWMPLPELTKDGE